MVEETNKTIYFNGINGETGRSLFSNLTMSDIAKVAKGEKINDKELQSAKIKMAPDKVQSFGVQGGDHLAQEIKTAGWGVVFSADLENREDIEEALSPLLELRKQQTGNTLFKKFGYSKEIDTTPGKWLSRNKASTGGDVIPHIVPYYLLLVGSPEDIPMHFQFGLDNNYATGRLYFETIEEYAKYAKQVAERETQQAQTNKKITLFGTQNDGDQSTKLSVSHFITPLGKHLEKNHSTWAVNYNLCKKATHSTLSDIIHSDKPPAFLLTASHGMGFSKGSPKQKNKQGALICSESPLNGEILEKHYFSASDIAPNTNLNGMMLFLFACYSGGTPQIDSFERDATNNSQEIAEQSFISKLPQRLLTAGASAIVAHFDRAWSLSFMGSAKENMDADTVTISSVIDEVVKGLPIGYAMNHINDYYAFQAISINNIRESIRIDPYYSFDDEELGTLYIRKNDARSYILLGDPASKIHE